MDRVFITGLRASSVIGVYDWERDIRQALVIDLELACDTSAAAQSDALADALDYAAISEQVVASVEAATFQLLEALAEHVAVQILRDFPVQGLVLGIKKPGAVAAAESVGVRIIRGALA